jgi:hypothetical protein
MSGFQTKAFEAQDKLLEILEVAQATPGSALAPFVLVFGLPGRREEQHLWVDEQIGEWAQGSETSGLSGRVESFKLSVYIYVRSTGANAKELRDQVRPIADAVSDAIGAAPFLGDTVMYAAIVEAEYESAFADPAGKAREGALRLDIGCTAYLA